MFTSDVSCVAPYLFGLYTNDPELSRTVSETSKETDSLSKTWTVHVCPEIFAGYFNLRCLCNFSPQNMIFPQT